MKKKFFLFSSFAIIAILTSVVIFSACQKDENIEKQVTQEKVAKYVPTNEDKQLIIALAKNLGVDTSTIVAGPELLVFDGDIVFNKQSIVVNSGNHLKAHYRSKYLLAETTTTVTLNIAPSEGVPTAWKNAIYQAVSDWNNLNTRLTFKVTELNQSSANQTQVWYRSFSSIGLNTSWMAAANYATGGKPGLNLWINKDKTSTNNLKRRAIGHETGHLIGFCHTKLNSPDPTENPGGIAPIEVPTSWYCPAYWDQSIMAASILDITTIFTGCDQDAIKSIY